MPENIVTNIGFMFDRNGPKNDGKTRVGSGRFEVKRENAVKGYRLEVRRTPGKMGSAWRIVSKPLYFDYVLERTE